MFFLIGTIVEQVFATDADTGVNAEISYRIQKGGFDDFQIDIKTGEVTVKSETKLDYDRRKEYNIEVSIQPFYVLGDFLIHCFSIGPCS